MAATLTTETRAIVHRTRGSSHGPITRLVSPGELGERLKPFVFLDLISFTATADSKGFGMHPHSGIATLTFMFEGHVGYDDTTGKQGVLLAGGVEWMRAGGGVWHSGGPDAAVTVIGAPVLGFQLWVALPAAEELAPAHSIYLAPEQVPQEGPARVLLGQYGAVQSPIPAPASMNYLAVRLKDGERWRYLPPASHTVAWVAVSSGRLDAGGTVGMGELAVFDECDKPIDFVARGETAFVLGSAEKHPHELVLGHYSVHTSRAALSEGEAEIRRIGLRLRKEGLLQDR